MATKDIITVWENDDIDLENIKFLHEPTSPVQFPISDHDKKIIQDLKDTADKIECAGIAANQIGYNKRIFIGVTSENRNSFEIYINPRIIEYSEESIVPGHHLDKKSSIKYGKGDFFNEEACLSIPGIWMTFPRYNKITVVYFTELGEEKIDERDSFLSKLFQHETDHLDGIIIIDRTLQAFFDNKKADIYTSIPYSNQKLPTKVGGNEDRMNNLMEEINRNAICNNYFRKPIGTYEEQYQHICMSPKLNSKCDKMYEDFCVSFIRNFKNCIYFEE